MRDAMSQRLMLIDESVETLRLTLRTANQHPPTSYLIHPTSYIIHQKLAVEFRRALRIGK